MKPTPEVMRLLRALTDDPLNIVYIVSGRVKSDLEKWFGDITALGVASEHGYYQKLPGDTEFTVTYPDLDFAWKDMVRPVMEVCVCACCLPRH